MNKAILLSLAMLPALCNAQTVQNDATAPLHLMKPAYTIPYGAPKAEEVKATIDRVRDYLDATTFTELDETGKQLKRGTFRLTSYEWGVTYSAMLRAGEVTGDFSYVSYALNRMSFLCQQAPKFLKWKEKGEKIDPLMEQVVSPDALDDCGAICSAMLKAKKGNFIAKKDTKLWDDQIDRYYDFIANKEHRYTDGQFARLRPVKNTVWLDDMFMGIPALALHDNWDEAARQFNLFHDKMWVPEKGLYRHGWVPGEHHPSFFWGRANGWALLTACELLDVKEDKDIMLYFKQHLDGILPLQHHDGAWHQLLDRNDTYLETSCTAIYCYCIAHAINKGWIDAETYGSQALLAWNYVNAHINAQGQVEGTCVGTGLAFDPAFYAYRPVNNYAAHGYGPAIWAGAEIYQMLTTQHIKMNDNATHFYPEDPGTDEPIFYMKE
ncbi:MAG: glycoside hydrolase family 88 protein [Bacteroidaceae bacterium]|nr:glycoside hydrolase family 88 protein [Bacteroidaceae bacterium]